MTYWAIKSGRAILPFTIRTTRWQAIADYCRGYRSSGEPRPTWDELVRGGHSAVKVEVRELKGEGKGA